MRKLSRIYLTRRGHVEDLRAEIRSLRELLASEQRRGAEIERQLGIVIESQFHRPVVAASAAPADNKSGMDAETLIDQPISDQAADAAWMKEQLESIATEHASWQQGKNETGNAE